MILLIGDGADPHLAAIEAKLTDASVECAVLSTSHTDLLQTEFSWFCEGGGGDIRLVQGEQTIRSDHVHSAFCLEPIFSAGAFFRNQEEQFWYRSWREALNGLFENLSGKGVLMNAPLSNAMAKQNKMALHAATRCDALRMPASVISNLKSDIRMFFVDGRPTVLKTLHQMPLQHAGDATMLLTTSVEVSSFDEFTEVGECPLYLQERVPKQYDVRALYVCGDLMACKIDASRSPRGALDWRAYDLPRTVHEATELPPETASQTRKLMSRLGLEYACIDYCVDAEDRYWLLDVNPFGRYLWMEHATGQPMSQLIANHLLHRAQTH